MTTHNDRWIKTLSTGGNLKATAVTAVNLVEEACKRHEMKGHEKVALGESIVATLLLSSRLKHGGRLSLSVKGSGHYKQSVIDGSADGSIKGFLSVRDEVKTTSNKPQKGERGIWGEGLINITRLSRGEKEPYLGPCELATGHLAKDLTVYLMQSEQIPSSVGISVELDKDGKIAAAGGFLVEALPGATASEIKQIEQNLKTMDDLAAQLTRNENPTVLLSNIFTEAAFTILEEKPLTFKCTCSRSKVMNALLLLGQTELKDMLEKDHGAKIRCDFCSENYNFNEEELGLLVK